MFSIFCLHTLYIGKHRFSFVNSCFSSQLSCILELYFSNFPTFDLISCKKSQKSRNRIWDACEIPQDSFRANKTMWG